MSQSLEIDLKTNSDVPQAMDKAKAATESFNKQVEKVSKTTKQSMDASKESTVSVGKQVEDIQKKFSTSFKDIFLSFLGPMALLTAAISIIGKMIADNAKKREEANQAAIDGTNELMSAEDRYYSKKRDNERKAVEETEQAALTREEVTKDFLLNTRSGRALMQLKGAGEENMPGFLKPFSKISREEQAGKLAKSLEIQSVVQLAIMEQAKNNPLPNDKDKTFKSPEGFSNVIGVGPNPVMEAMARQIEIQEQQLAELQKISGSTPAGQGDFTKGTQSK